MPTMPFSGTAVDWALVHPVVDLRRTPSRMGLVSEIFRRSPDVVRSVHPTHPVAAWGERAKLLVAGHSEAGTPCGAGSPYHRLLEFDGRIVMLGADVTSLTFFHTAEALLADGWPVSPFTQETFRLTTLDERWNGARHNDAPFRSPAIAAPESAQAHARPGGARRLAAVARGPTDGGDRSRARRARRRFLARLSRRLRV